MTTVLKMNIADGTRLVKFGHHNPFLNCNLVTLSKVETARLRSCEPNSASTPWKYLTNWNAAVAVTQAVLSNP